jgi:nucleotide-binding universal stress UspA family protein
MNPPDYQSITSALLTHWLSRNALVMLALQNSLRRHCMFQHILVPIDTSQCSHAAAQLAGRLARAWGSQITFAYIFDGFATPEDTALLEGFRQYTRHVPRLVLEPMKTNLSQTLVEIANREVAELILIGVHAHAKLEREVLDGVAKSISSQAKIPVLIVPIETKKIGFEARWAQGFLPQEFLGLAKELP